jgi:hypothetical protein
MLSKQRGSPVTVGSQNIIELNGQRYDALTGKMVTEASRKPNQKIAHQAVKPTGGVSMDGFSRRRPVAAPKQPARSIHKSSADHSQTLMRSGVKKPQTIIKQGLAKTHQQKVASHNTPIKTPARVMVDPRRLERAQQIAKSRLVSKFSDDEPRIAGKPTVKPLAMSHVPEVPIIGHVAASNVVNTAPSGFQNALDQAVSHQQPRLKKKRLHHHIAKKLHVSPKTLTISSASLLFLLVGGFIAYQNVPNVAMRVASARSGVDAALPAYKPAGFAFSGPIQYKPGQITVSFKSNSDEDRKFSIIQAASAWNSETLLENFVATTSEPYQTYQDGGKTIYIYNGTNATWVDGGVWYRVEGKSSLSSDQLLRLADSIK